MQLQGKQKAAMLLMCLDPATASELLKGQPSDVVEDIAMELTRIDTNSQFDDSLKTEVAKEFYTSISGTGKSQMNVRFFVNELLNNISDSDDEGGAFQSLQQKDPFVAISSYNAGLVTAALEGEHPQTMSIIISELPTQTATQVLKRFDEKTSKLVVYRMTKHDQIPAMIKRRVGDMISKRLESMTPDDEIILEETKSRETLRSVALVLSGMNKQLRDTMLEEIEDRDETTGKTVRALLVTWEDITKIADRSLQTILRNIDADILAKALIGADDRVASKIFDNISERASSMVEEETQLMAKPTKKEIAQAREKVVQPLREANEAEELTFIDQEDE